MKIRNGQSFVYSNTLVADLMKEEISDKDYQNQGIFCILEYPHCWSDEESSPINSIPAVVLEIFSLCSKLAPFVYLSLKSGL